MVYKRLVPAVLFIFILYVANINAMLYADDRENDITPEPTAEISITESPSSTPEPQATDTSTDTNTSEIKQAITEQVHTGDNTAEGDVAIIKTADATASADITNEVNTNISGTDILTPTTTVEASHEGVVDLRTDPVYCTPVNGETVSPQPNSDGSNLNDATITNNVDIKASSGDNQAEGVVSSIDTGNASATVGVTNTANTNITGNCAQYGTVNVYGDQKGNIILPYEGSYVVPTSTQQKSQAIPSQPTITVTNNTADVHTSIDASANTGDNTASVIQAGDSTITVREITNANTTISGNNWVLVQVNGADRWQGTFAGWDGEVYRNGAYAAAWAQLPFPADSSGTSVAHTENSATVQNNISVEADTGHNTVGGLLSLVSTGDATIRVNILNNLNTTIVGNNWYFQTINVFNNLVGDVVFPRPDLEISMKPHESRAKLGDEVTYTITYSNIGTLWADNVTVESTLPEGSQFLRASSGGEYRNGLVHWDVGLLREGAQGGLTFTVALNRQPVNNLWVNAAHIQTTTKELVQSNNTAEVVIGFEQQEPQSEQIVDDIPVTVTITPPAYTYIRTASYVSSRSSVPTSSAGEVKGATQAKTEPEKSSKASPFFIVMSIILTGALGYKLRDGIWLFLFE